MNHAHLRAFHAVASQGSFTRAAQMLHVTQPTLSDHVKSLEQRYGVKLFERRGRGVVLTALGHALMDITRRQSGLEAEAEQLLSRAQGLMQGQLRVVADGPYLVVPLLGEFHRHYPGIRLSMNFGNSEQVLTELTELRADVGVMPEHIDNDHLYALPLLRDRLVLFVERSHPWSRRHSVRLQELTTQQIILRESGSNTRAVFEQALRQKDIRLKSILEIGSREGVREAVAAQLGIGVTNESEFGHDNRLHKLKIRDAAVNVTEYICCLQETCPIPVVQAFFAIIRRHQDSL